MWMLTGQLVPLLKKKDIEDIHYEHLLFTPEAWTEHSTIVVEYDDVLINVNTVIPDP